MAKTSAIQRNLKRVKLAAKYLKKNHHQKDGRGNKFLIKNKSRLKIDYIA